VSNWINFLTLPWIIVTVEHFGNTNHSKDYKEYLDIVSKLLSAPKHKRYPTLSANIYRLSSMFHCPYFTVFHGYQHSAARGGIR
jgi:hypothetical protein